MKKVDLVCIFLLFYLGWFGSVFLAKTRFSSASLLLPLLLVLFLRIRTGLGLKQTAVAFSLSLFGILFDGLVIHLELITASGDSLFQVPIWLISIWLLFSFSMIQLGTQFRPPTWLAALLGFLMGPLSYKSGEVFGVLSFTSSLALLVYAIFWAVMFPVVLYLSKRFI